MKHLPLRSLVIFALLPLLTLVLGGCVVGVEGGAVGSSGGTQVTFRLDANGSNVGVDRVLYRVGENTRTVEFPSLPWSARVSARPGDAIAVRAVASASDGSSLRLSFEAFDGGREVTRGTRICDQVGCPGFELDGQIPR